MNIETLKERAKELSDQIEILDRERQRLTSEMLKQVSEAFIAINCITIDTVELSTNKPWFFHLDKFGEWLKNNSTPDKVWAEWNGRIYRKSDIIEGRLIETPAFLEDIPK